MAARPSLVRLSVEESTSSDFEAFDPRRSDRLGAQQKSRYRLRVDETSRLQVETDDRSLGVGDVSSRLPSEIGRPIRGRVRTRRTRSLDDPGEGDRA